MRTKPRHRELAISAESWRDFVANRLSKIVNNLCDIKRKMTLKESFESTMIDKLRQKIQHLEDRISILEHENRVSFGLTKNKVNLF